MDRLCRELFATLCGIALGFDGARMWLDAAFFQSGVGFAGGILLLAAAGVVYFVTC